MGCSQRAMHLSQIQSKKTGFLLAGNDKNTPVIKTVVIPAVSLCFSSISFQNFNQPGALRTLRLDEKFTGDAKVVSFIPVEEKIPFQTNIAIA